MSALICGTLSYDTVMVFNDKFRHHVWADQIQQAEAFDVQFMVPDLRRQFGGCAGNIAYNLRMLGLKPFIMSTVGNDFDNYADWLTNQDLPRTYITAIDHSFTAQTYMTMDMEDNKITAFHPGAMSFAHQNSIWRVKDISLGLICMENTEAMVQHALQLTEMGIPFVFDPGYSIYQLDGDELMRFIEQASWILVNEKEWLFMRQHTGLSEEQMAMRVQALIITLGDNGARIYAQGTRYQIPPARAKAANDPAGCGDAFCAGVLYGLLKDADWETTGRVAALMGAIKVEHHGSQNHRFNLELFKARFKKNFGYALII